MTENGQKWPETGILDFLRKSSHYFCQTKILGLLTFSENWMPEKNLILKLWPKMLLPNQISVFFHYQ